MTIEEAKQRIKVLHEVADLIYEQAWQSAQLPENMRVDLFDYLYNDYATPDIQKHLGTKCRPKEQSKHETPSQKRR